MAEVSSTPLENNMLGACNAIGVWGGRQLPCIHRDGNFYDPLGNAVGQTANFRLAAPEEIAKLVADHNLQLRVTFFIPADAPAPEVDPLPDAIPPTAEEIEQSVRGIKEFSEHVRKAMELQIKSGSENAEGFAKMAVVFEPLWKIVEARDMKALCVFDDAIHAVLGFLHTGVPEENLQLRLGECVAKIVQWRGFWIKTALEVQAVRPEERDEAFTPDDEDPKQHG